MILTAYAQILQTVQWTVIALSSDRDNGEFFETKADYAKTWFTGFIHLNGASSRCCCNRSQVYDAEGKKVETFDGKTHFCKEAQEKQRISWNLRF